MRVDALFSSPEWWMIQSMKPSFAARRTSGFIFGLIFFWTFAAGSRLTAAEPKPEAVTAFNEYVAQVESRLEQQHHSATRFLAPEDAARLRAGEQIMEQVPLPSGTDLPGAMLHHWRGTAFARGVTAAQFERMMKDVQAYPSFYAPQVAKAHVLAHRAD